MPLKDVFCQEKAVASLEQAYDSGKVAHAYIFAGPDGVGKFTTAKEFARMLLCKKPVKTGDFTDSCGVCESCRVFDAGSHPDFEHVYKELLEFTRDGKGKDSPVDFPIDVVREFVIEKVSQRPALSTRRVFVLSEAEKLNNESQNCLLKVLEEPPSYCCIILVCTRPDKLLPTIRSRCQILRFGPIAEDKIIEKLYRPGLSEKQAKFLARFAGGCLGLACTYSQLELAEANLYQTKTDLVDTLAKFEYKDALEMAENLQKKSKELAAVWTKLAPATSKTDINRKATKIILQIIICTLHDAMLTNIAVRDAIVNFDQPEQIKKIARRFDAEQAAQKIADCFKTLHWLESSVNERLIFEQLLLNLAETDKITYIL
jgi:DNA polymerase III subunit delta'